MRETFEERLRRKKLTALFGPKTAKALSQLPEEIPVPTDEVLAVVEALRKHAARLLEKHRPLVEQVSADGGQTFGELDPRLRDWGEKFTANQVALVELAKKMPSLFVKK